MNTAPWSCENCNKEYKSRKGLWGHKKKCIPVNLENNTKVEELEAKLQLVMETQIKQNGQFIKKQGDLMGMMAPVMKKIGENGGISSQNNCNNTTNNTINNNININLYLNEHCKNALNIEDFVKKIQLSLEDYNFALENGYAKGVTNVLIKNIEDFAKDKKIEIEALKLKEQYRKEFIGNVAHELKTPIFTIQGYISNLLDGAMDDKDLLNKYLH